MSKYADYRGGMAGYCLHLIISKLKSAGRWYLGLYRGRPWYIKTVSVLATFFVSFIIYLGAVDINFLWLFGKSPGFSTISNPVNPQASELYSADGVMIGKYFNENRTPVAY